MVTTRKMIITLRARAWTTRRSTPWRTAWTATMAFTAAADTISPTVSMTAPTSGGSVSGSITVSATASDNIGVASVQFVLDGVNYGSPLTTSPYSFTWNSSTVSPGTHTWWAIAKDTS